MMKAIRAILLGGGLWGLVACAPVAQTGGAPQAEQGQTGVTLTGSARIGVTRTFD
jgi:hypothetical protein